jgi:hypothetical protein
MAFAAPFTVVGHFAPARCQPSGSIGRETQKADVGCTGFGFRSGPNGRPGDSRYGLSLASRVITALKTTLSVVLTAAMLHCRSVDTAT